MSKSKFDYKIVKSICALFFSMIPLLAPTIVNSSVLEDSLCKKYADTFRKYRYTVNQFKSEPSRAAKGTLVPDDILDKQHAKCLDDFIREKSNGKYGIFQYEGEYIIIDVRA